jgi:hypothetical protein
VRDYREWRARVRRVQKMDARRERPSLVGLRFANLSKGARRDPIISLRTLPSFVRLGNRPEETPRFDRIDLRPPFGDRACHGPESMHGSWIQDDRGWAWSPRPGDAQHPCQSMKSSLRWVRDGELGFPVPSELSRDSLHVGKKVCHRPLETQGRAADPVSRRVVEARRWTGLGL